VNLNVHSTSKLLIKLLYKVQYVEKGKFYVNGYKQEKGERSMLAPLSGYMPKSGERLRLRYQELVVMMQEALFNNSN
jgi:hypothetical protein